MPVYQPIPFRLPVVMVIIAWRGLLTAVIVKQDISVGIQRVHQDHVIQVYLH